MRPLVLLVGVACTDGRRESAQDFASGTERSARTSAPEPGPPEAQLTLTFSTTDDQQEPTQRQVQASPAQR
jgi:hypothetical protein